MRPGRLGCRRARTIFGMRSQLSTAAHKHPCSPTVRHLRSTPSVNRRTATIRAVSPLTASARVSTRLMCWRARSDLTVDNYLGRVTKPRILEAVREVKGESSAQLIDHLKKAEMAKEAEPLLDGSGWLRSRCVSSIPIPMRRHWGRRAKQAARIPRRRCGSGEWRPEDPQGLAAAERNHRAGRLRPSRGCLGTSAQRWSPFLWARLERESRAGKGLSRRGQRRAPGGSPHSCSPKESCHDRISALDACRCKSHLRRRQGRATASDRARTRPAHRCHCSA